MVRSGRFFFALFSLFRFSLSVGLLERPLVVGVFWGIFTGDYSTSLYIAIFFELFWLDLIPVGTFIPPHLTAATFAALSLTTYFGLEQPAQIMGVMFASMPLAWLGSKAEQLIREQEKGTYNKLLKWTRSSDGTRMPLSLVIQPLSRTLIIGGLLFYLSILVLKFTFEFFISTYPSFLASVDITWPHLWIAATMGGLMALRLKRAYGVLVMGASIVAIFILLGRF